MPLIWTVIKELQVNIWKTFEKMADSTQCSSPNAQIVTKPGFRGRKEHNFRNWEQCWELSKFVAEGGNRWINIFHGRKKSWVLLMRRKLDIFSEIRLRCAPGCYPKLWKFEWILNWREGQIESPFLCSYTKWIVNEVCEQSIRILERFLNFRMALWKYHKLHNHERKL